MQVGGYIYADVGKTDFSSFTSLSIFLVSILVDRGLFILLASLLETWYWKEKGIKIKSEHFDYLDECVQV